MSWFQKITQNPHIDVALLVDGVGRLVATSNQISSESQRVASMIKAAEVLARGLSMELDRGEMRSLQLSMQHGHLLVIPVGNAYYLIVLTPKNAPLEAIFDQVQHLLGDIGDDEIVSALRPPVRSPLDDIDVNELIEAVSEWLAEQQH